MAISKETRQYVVTFVKRKYEWQIQDLQKRVEILEKTITTLLNAREKQQKIKKK